MFPQGLASGIKRSWEYIKRKKRKLSACQRKKRRAAA